MSNVKDLDALVPEQKRATLGGVEYVLPGDLPLEIYLRINNAAAKAEEDDSRESEVIDALLSATVDLFAWDAADADKASIAEVVRSTLGHRGVKFLMDISRAIYGEDVDETPADETDPSQPPVEAAPDGTPNTTSPSESSAS